MSVIWFFYYCKALQWDNMNILSNDNQHMFFHKWLHTFINKLQSENSKSWSGVILCIEDILISESNLLCFFHIIQTVFFIPCFVNESLKAGVIISLLSSPSSIFFKPFNLDSFTIWPSPWPSSLLYGRQK